MSLSGNSTGRWNKLSKAFGAFLGLSLLAGVLVGALLAPAAIAGTTVTKQGVEAFNSLPDYLKIEPPDQYTSFYATKGGQPVKIAQFYFQNRVDVKWNQVSQYVKDAAVSTEDPRFYSEGGIDVLGILRGAASTVSGNGVQGGSSITQQYVKNVLVQRCEADYPVDANAPTKTRDAQQTKLDTCYSDAAGQTVPRKIQEIRYATGVAKQYPKNDILLGYLNLVGFGGQVYGVEAAAKYYFNTTAAKLTLNESATLVAILNNPANLRIDQTAKTNVSSNPSNGFKATKDRRNYVLERMVKEHKITASVAAATEKQPITPHITPTPSGCQSAQQYDAGFFCSYVQQTVLNNSAFGKTAADRQALFRQGGINVYTTLDLDLQNTAQASMDSYLPHSDPALDLGGAQTSMEVGTGKVVTMVENKTYSESPDPPAGSTSVNYVTPSPYGGSIGFQMGSSFKPFVLADWLENGHTLYQGINGTSMWFNNSSFKSTCGSNAPYSDSGTFQVYNDTSSEYGYHTVLDGTTQSINTIYMNMAEQLNLCDVHQLAKKMGVDSGNPSTPWFTGPSSAIGSGNDVSPLQVAQAYAAFANGGTSCTPIVINSITRVDTGASVPVPKTTCTKAIPTDVANAVLYALKTVMTSGTGILGNPNDGVPLAGKTGTAGVNGNAGATQNWIATTTSKVAQVTWVGNVEGTVGLRNQYFTNSQTGQVINGGDAKLIIARPIIAALNAKYGGAQFGAPPASLLYGGTSQAPVTTPQFTVPTVPTAPTTTAPTTAPTQPQPQTTTQPAAPPAPVVTPPAQSAPPAPAQSPPPTIPAPGPTATQ
ncbi:transglycosylase domain-containing protein [Gryllotalpicola reticulitermitis]|uniref:Transglycosylase domain-containing protein n=1 Tax=Gryllotalpicola reticulitermitis TaxID=1184153 RepID=A0ABV8Q7E1_9MICO